MEKLFFIIFPYIISKSKWLIFKITYKEFKKRKCVTLTLPQTGHRPESLLLLAASCILEVTSPWVPNKCLSKPWSVKNLNWHFWQLRGGLLYIIFGWILILCIHCMWFLSCSRSLMYPSQISQITKEFFEVVSPGLAGATGDAVAVVPRGKGVIEILGCWAGFLPWLAFCKSIFCLWETDIRRIQTKNYIFCL